MALYGSDPIFMAQNADAFIGREAVEASYQYIFQTIKLNVVFTIHEIVAAANLRISTSPWVTLRPNLRLSSWARALPLISRAATGANEAPAIRSPFRKERRLFF
jgi:ketosteroid isomerase-like protein